MNDIRTELTNAINGQLVSIHDYVLNNYSDALDDLKNAVRHETTRLWTNQILGKEFVQESDLELLRAAHKDRTTCRKNLWDLLHQEGAPFFGKPFISDPIEVYLDSAENAAIAQTKEALAKTGTQLKR